MKRILFAFILLFSYTLSNAQDFTGQWKGQFADNSTSALGWGGNTCEYVLDLEVSGNQITGYSYTYFSDAGKKYYTICKLVGSIDRKKKYVEVRETERTKTNVPINIINCFQVHRLNYNERSGLEYLEGDWKPAPNQQGNCGFGFTSLERRKLSKSYPRFGSTARNKRPGQPHASASVAKAKPKPAKPAPVAKEKTKPTEKPAPVLVKKEPKVTIITTPNTKITAPVLAPAQYEKRNTEVLKTLRVVGETIKVMLYDNGEIDGDSISLFYNKELIVNRQRLSDKALTIELPVAYEGTNELTMYAENLGSIPPNTALMVVTDGKNRYEVRITSDLQKSGTIHFVREKP